MKVWSSLFAGWGHLFAIWGGSFMVATGVALHLPMFWMGRMTGFKLAGMPMGIGMLAGMAFIVLGVIAASNGLLPPERNELATLACAVPPEDAPLTKAHWFQIVLVGIALIVDLMKAATLGFVTPGVRAEDNLGAAAVALLPLSGLSGTTAGSLVWGWLADIYGRRASILLAAVMFVGTSICGAMPSFSWNILMCFMMGLAAGGMLPVANELLAEIVPTRPGVGVWYSSAASGQLGAILRPANCRRCCSRTSADASWLTGFPTALILIGLSPFLPESARFLLEMGRFQEARRTLARYGTVLILDRTAARDVTGIHVQKERQLGRRMGLTVSLTLAALAWGCINFGVLLWLPSALIAEGRSVGPTSALIARSALIAIPTVAATTYLYSLWSTKGVLILSIGPTVLGLVATPLRSNSVVPFFTNPVISVSFLVVGTSAVISSLVPYAAESFPMKQCGLATGWVAGCSKVGGVWLKDWRTRYGTGISD